MAGEPDRDACARSGAIVTMHSVVNIHAKWRSASCTTCSVGSTLVRAAAAEHERAPRDPQADAERGGVRPVAGDVADHGVDGAVGVLHRVVEVAAQQRAPAARAVVRGQLAAPGR